MDPPGTRKAIFLSECNADISSYLSSDHLSKRGDVTEAELIMTRGMSLTQLTRITICPRHRPLEILPDTKVMPGYKFGGKHVINFQMAVEICFLFGKTIIWLLWDRVSVISFAGFGYFFSES